MTLSKIIQQLLCRHEREVLYPSARFQVHGRTIVQPWVCRCRKCGKIEEIICGGE